MQSDRVALVGDHRGKGLDRLFTGLEALGYRTVRTSCLRTTLARLESDPPDLLVLHPLVPGGGTELATLERGRAGEPPVPLLLVAPPEEDATAQSAQEHLATGAWDLIPASAGPRELSLRVGRLEAWRDAMFEMQELRHRASHDDRTDLLRVRAFESRLLEHVSAAQRHGLEMALALIDLDDFGKVNKRHDHTVGDILIAQVGEVIRRTLRAEDVAGRLGGDEFAVLLPYTRKVDAARVISRLREEIHKLSGRPVGARDDIVVSASIGFETYDGRDLDSARELRDHTERALRHAKDLGGNRAVYYRSLRGDAVAPGGEDS